MADSYVTSGATIKCSCGDKSVKLTVYPDRTVFLTEKPMANISDHVSMYNIWPFGKCRTTSYPATGAATAANHGTLTPMPCVPGTISEWLQGKGDYIIKGKPALLKSSYCKCQWGGIITITDDGQTDTGDADLSREHRETPDEILAKQQHKRFVSISKIADKNRRKVNLVKEASKFISKDIDSKQLVDAGLSQSDADIILKKIRYLRREAAYNVYKNSPNVNMFSIESHLNGIDFSCPIEIGVIPKGTKMGMYINKDIRGNLGSPGNYAFDISDGKDIPTTDHLGVADRGISRYEIAIPGKNRKKKHSKRKLYIQKRIPRSRNHA